MGYDVVLAAVNSIGYSRTTRLQAYTIKDPEKQTGETSSFFVNFAFSHRDIQKLIC